MRQSLTPVEQDVYHYLIDFLAENTYQPSVRDIGRRFQIKSTKTVSDLLQTLATKGYIERDPSRSRGVRLLGYEKDAGTMSVPYYGKVHAGEPSPLPEHEVGRLKMDRRFVPDPNAYFLRIKGDSMIGRGINDGDYVLVNPSVKPDEGAVIAARIGDEATIKTLTHRGEQIVLEPANPQEREIPIGSGDDFAVLGVVAGIFRPFFDRDAFTKPVATA